MKIAFTPGESPRHVRPARHTRPPLTHQAMIAVGAVTVLVLSGCAGGDSTGTSSEQAVSGVASARDSAALTPQAGTESEAGAASGRADVIKPGAVPVVGVGPKVTKNASLDLRVKDIAAAAARVRIIATELQAQVLSEQIGRGGPGEPQPLPDADEPFGGFGTLTLSVPADKLDAALDQLAKIGTVLQRNTSSQDITSQYVDTESRLKTMRASVERVRALMAQAKDLGQVVALESEMSRRQGDLESLQSQLTALKTSVERSTLAVSLSTPGNEPVTDNTFLAGLRSGWDAFTASAAGLFKAIGAALPFAVFLVLLGVPLSSWWRRNRANRSTVGPAPATPSASPAPGSVG